MDRKPQHHNQSGKVKSLVAIFIVLCCASFFIYKNYSKTKSPIILIILDTLRADHLGYSGYERDTSPVLDIFAKEHSVFPNAVASAPWTPPSVATMFTGLYPTSHTMMPPSQRELAKKQAAKLPSKAITIAEILKKEGYATAAISPNPWITPRFGFDQGFDHFFKHLRKDATFITREAKEMIELLVKTDNPFFSVIHYLDPHDPYTPPKPYSEMFTGTPPRDFQYTEEMTKNINQYDGEIRFLDTELGNLFAWLKEKKLYDNSTIIIVGDHGEQFLEHGGFTHGLQLYNEEINIPLLVKTAGNTLKGTFEQTVSVADVFPTILEAAGIAQKEALPAIAWIPGVSLSDTEAINRRRGVFSEIDRKYQQRAFTSTEGRRLIAGSNILGREVTGEYGKQPVTCFDSNNDQLAQVNLLENSEEKIWCEELGELLDESVKLAMLNGHSGSAEIVEVDNETLEQLKSLGYVQ